MRRARAALLLAVLAWASPAAAEEDAAAHYKKGRSLYNVSEYRAALEEFKQAYVLHEDPAFLYNIAQCHRQLGNHREAITFYKRFLNESPRATNRKEIERLIGELEDKATADKAAAEKAAPEPRKAPEPAAPTPAEAAPPRENLPAVPPPAPPAPADAPAKPAGLHVELGFGVGVLHDDFNWLALTNGSATGASGAFQVAATYGLLPRLAAGLVFSVESVQSPRVELSGIRTDNVDVGTLGFLGVLADWRLRPGPTGWHFEGGLGAARMTIKDKSSIVAARHPAGGGGMLAAGYDWSVTGDWKLGFLVRVTGVALTADNTDHKVFAGSGLVVLGYR